jgi:hypothetical protein
MSEQTITGYGYVPGVFRIGDVLSRAFELVGRQFPLYFVIYLLSALPNNAILLIAGVSGRPQPGQPPNLGASLALLGGSLLALALTILAQSMVVFIAYNALKSQKVTVGAAFELALNRFFPMLGALLCLGFAMSFGFLLLIFPGLMIAVRYYVSPIVCLVEQRGPIDSLGRSAKLTDGYRWPILGLALLIGVASVILTIPASVLLPALVGRVPTTIVSMLITAALGSVNTVIYVAVYQALRLAKDGGDGDHLARVFD